MALDTNSADVLNIDLGWKTAQFRVVDISDRPVLRHRHSKSILCPVLSILLLVDLPSFASNLTARLYKRLRRWMCLSQVDAVVASRAVV